MERRAALTCKYVRSTFPSGAPGDIFMRYLLILFVVASAPATRASSVRVSPVGGHVTAVYPSDDEPTLLVSLDEADWAAFVAEFATVFFDGAPLRYVVVGSRARPDGQLVVDAERVNSEGVPYLNGPAAFVFDASGVLFSFVGNVFDLELDCHDTAATLDLAAERVEQLAGVNRALVKASRSSERDWRGRMREDELVRTVLTADEHLGACVWSIQVDTDKFLIDGSGQLVDSGSNILNYGTGTASIRRRTYPASAADHEFPNGTAISTVGAGYNPDFFGVNCTWELSNFSGAHKLDQLHDDDGAECTDVIPCGSSQQFECIGTGSDAMREQNAYYFVYRARQHARDHAWNFNPPQNTTSAVRVIVDIGPPYCGDAPACYSPDLTDIYVRAGDNDNSSAGSMYHEYGHHIVWTYGGLEWIGCTEGSNESAGLNETLSNVFAYAASTRDNGARYNTPWGRVANGQPHMSGGPIFVYPGSHSCATEVHNRGLMFEQAAWELIHNVNCADTSCTSSTTGANHLWPGIPSNATSASYVIDCLAYALDTTPYTTTYESIASQCAVRAGVRHGAGTRAEIEAVFAHHGL